VQGMGRARDPGIFEGYSDSPGYNLGDATLKHRVDVHTGQNGESMYQEDMRHSQACLYAGFVWGSSHLQAFKMATYKFS
jgi:hypothetical protein